MRDISVSRLNSVFQGDTTSNMVLGHIFKHRTVLAAAILISGLLPVFCLYGEENWSQDGWEKAFSMRNYQLGMTLSEFQAERFPGWETNPKPYAVCSNDPDPGWEALPQTWEKAGLVRCVYYHKNVFLDRVEATAPRLAGSTPKRTEFIFVKPERSNDYLLYHIFSTIGTDHYYTLREAYEAKMGKKPVIQTEMLQNAFGHTFENSIAIWENTVSTLILEEYHLDIETSKIELILKPLLGIANKRRGEAEKKVAEDNAKQL